jgi:hypothetical protein
VTPAAPDVPAAPPVPAAPAVPGRDSPPAHAVAINDAAHANASRD